MKRALVFALASGVALLTALSGCVQPRAGGMSDPYRLTAPKGFTAKRASSNNADWNSNDDRKRPIPGETTVLADLPGPGIVSHI